MFSREPNPASARLSLSRRWGFRLDKWYASEGDSSGTPPLNEELRHLMENKSLLVTIPWRMVTHIEGILASLVDITSWIDQVLCSFAGLSSYAS